MKPGLKVGGWTSKEERDLFQYYKEYQGNFKAMENDFPCRTSEQLRQKFIMIMRRKLRRLNQKLTDDLKLQGTIHQVIKNPESLEILLEFDDRDEKDIRGEVNELNQDLNIGTDEEEIKINDGENGLKVIDNRVSKDLFFYGKDLDECHSSNQGEIVIKNQTHRPNLMLKSIQGFCNQDFNIGSKGGSIVTEPGNRKMLRLDKTAKTNEFK